MKTNGIELKGLKEIYTYIILICLSFSYAFEEIAENHLIVGFSLIILTYGGVLCSTINKYKSNATYRKINMVISLFFMFALYLDDIYRCFYYLFFYNTYHIASIIYIVAFVFIILSIFYVGFYDDDKATSKYIAYIPLSIFYFSFFNYFFNLLLIRHRGELKILFVSFIYVFFVHILAMNLCKYLKK